MENSFASFTFTIEKHAQLASSISLINCGFASHSVPNWYLGRINSDLKSWVFYVWIICSVSWLDWHFVYSEALIVFARATLRDSRTPRALSNAHFFFYRLSIKSWFTTLPCLNDSTFSHANDARSNILSVMQSQLSSTFLSLAK